MTNTAVTILPEQLSSSVSIMTLRTIENEMLFRKGYFYILAREVNITMHKQK